MSQTYQTTQDSRMVVFPGPTIPSKMNPERLARCLSNTYGIPIQFEDRTKEDQEKWIKLSTGIIKSILGKHFDWTLERLGYPEES
jgi:hypothetical protein